MTPETHTQIPRNLNQHHATRSCDCSLPGALDTNQAVIYLYIHNPIQHEQNDIQRYTSPFFSVGYSYSDHLEDPLTAKKNINTGGYQKF